MSHQGGHVVQGKVLTATAIASPAQGSTTTTNPQTQQKLQRVTQERDNLEKSNQRLLSNLAAMRKALDDQNQQILALTHGKAPAQEGGTHHEGDEAGASAGNVKNRFLRFVDDVTEKTDWKAECENFKRLFQSTKKSAEAEVSALQLNVSLLQQRNRESSESLLSKDKQIAELTRSVELLKDALTKGEEEAHLSCTPSKEKVNDDDDFDALFDGKKGKPTSSPTAPKPVSSASRLFAEIEQLRNELAAAKEGLEKSKKETEAAKDETAAVRLALQDSQQLEEQNRNLTSERTMLRQQVERLTQLTAELESRRASDGDEELELLEKRLSIANDQVTHETHRRSVAEEKAKELRASCVLLEGEMKKARDAMCSLELQLDRKRAEADEAKAWERKFNNTREDLRSALAQLQTAKSGRAAANSSGHSGGAPHPLLKDALTPTIRRGIFAEAVLWPKLQQRTQQLAEERGKVTELECALTEARQEVDDAKAEVQIETRRLTKDNENLRAIAKSSAAEAQAAREQLQRLRCEREPDGPGGNHPLMPSSASSTSRTSGKEEDNNDDDEQPQHSLDDDEAISRPNAANTGRRYSHAVFRLSMADSSSALSPYESSPSGRSFGFGGSRSLSCNDLNALGVQRPKIPLGLPPPLSPKVSKMDQTLDSVTPPELSLGEDSNFKQRRGGNAMGLAVDELERAARHHNSAETPTNNETSLVFSTSPPAPRSKRQYHDEEEVVKEDIEPEPCVPLKRTNTMPPLHSSTLHRTQKDEAKEARGATVQLSSPCSPAPTAALAASPLPTPLAPRAGSVMLEAASSSTARTAASTASVQQHPTPKKSGFFSKLGSKIGMGGSSGGSTLTATSSASAAEKNAHLDVEKAQLVVRETLEENMKLSAKVKELSMRLQRYEAL